MYTSIWPLLNSEISSGVTLHEIDSGIDTGPIIEQREFSISKYDRARDLYEKYLTTSFELIKERLNDIITGNLSVTTQAKNYSTYYSKQILDFSKLEVDLNQTTFSIAKQIYSFSFREYQLPLIKGETIVEAEILDARSTVKPSTILDKQADFYDLVTIDFDIRLYFDRIDRINEFSTCTVDQASRLLKGLCGVNDRTKNGWSLLLSLLITGILMWLSFSWIEELISMIATIMAHRC